MRLCAAWSCFHSMSTCGKSWCQGVRRTWRHKYSTYLYIVHTQRKSLFIQCASRDSQNFKAAVNFTAESNTIAPLDTQTNTNKHKQNRPNKTKKTKQSKTNKTQHKQNKTNKTKQNKTTQHKQNKQTPLCDTLSRCSHHFTMATMNTRAAAFWATTPEIPIALSEDWKQARISL